MKTKKKLLPILLVLLLAAGLTVAAFYDLPLSKYLAGFHEENGIYALDVPAYASILEVIGEWIPCTFAAIALFISTCGLLRKYTKKPIQILICVLSVFPGTALMQYALGNTREHFHLEEKMPMLLTVGISALLAIAIFILVSRLPKHVLESLYYPAFYTIIGSAVVLFVISGMKVVWGRVRLREMVALCSFEGFTPWFLPNFFSGSHSFPSGHTGYSTLLTMIPMWLYGKGEKYKTPLSVFLYLYVAVMAFSRLAAGAHFLSDVIMGFTVSFVILLFFKKQYAKRQLKP